MTDKSLASQLTTLATDVAGTGQGYAASHSARDLVAQWLPALASGAQLIDLLGDVDDVITQLLSFRLAAAAAGGIELEMPALELEHFAEAGSDFKLREGSTSCWIKVDTVAVHVKRSAEGVCVDLFPAESTENLCGAALSFEDAEEAQCTDLGVDLSSVSEWVTQQYQLDFDQASHLQRSLWIQAYHGKPMEFTSPGM